MSTMKLRSVPYGTTFEAFGDQFVALDYIGGGVLAIRRDNWKNSAFDEDGKNNLKTANIGGKLNNFLNVLEDGGANVNSCSCTGFYLRPALILSSDLLISIEDDEEQNGGKTEAGTYAEYRAYVKDWAEYGNGEEAPPAFPR